MFHYRAYGLRIRSEISLPELIRTENADPDVVISIAEEPSIVVDGEAENVVTLSWEEVGDFQVVNGCRVRVHVHEQGDEELVRFPILGPVLGTLLRQRGHIVLHASAVSVEERVVAFIGHKGYGKSTVAACMHFNGHPLVTDDVLPVNLVNGGPATAQPGFPQLSLWPESVVALGKDPSALPSLHARVGKKAVPVSAEFVDRGPLEVAGIYVLGQGRRLEIHELTPRERFVELLRHSYCSSQLSRFGADAMSVAFRQYAQLAEIVPVRRLVRPDDLDALSAMVPLVERDVRSISPYAPEPSVSVSTVA